jgi:hypothetical protein
MDLTGERLEAARSVAVSSSPVIARVRRFIVQSFVVGRL